ncbi:MAG: type III-B CRISPR-associated protein Cas10/Cmr2 [Nitrososphaerota archaeon]|nr:type III-B CRISPR-associated protein Cas10/Cmr2 [Nitrososphaerota archaeon]
MKHNDQNQKRYLLVCETGPVFDFVRNSRKTRDYWAASFLFSYLMGKISESIQKNGGRIIRPDLQADPIVHERFRPTGGVRAGSIPDQLYAVVGDRSKGLLKDGLCDVFYTGIEHVIDQVVSGLHIATKDNRSQIMEQAKEQARSYFYLFHVLYQIDAGYPTYNEFLEAERRIKMRGMVTRFDQTVVPPDALYLQKWSRCDLCGDRDMVYWTDHDSEAEMYKKERICGVCLLKRFLYEADDMKKVALEPMYDSTSDIAAVPMMNASYALREFGPLKSAQEEFFKRLEAAKAEASQLDKTDQQAFQNKLPGHPVYGRLFFSGEGKKVRKQFEEIENQKQKLDPSFRKTTWLNRPFYAVVYMDGDNMGSAFRGNDEYFKQISDAVSETLSIFTRRAEKIVGNNLGQLIYAGGDDVNFMVHPEYLIDSVSELTTEYKELFRRKVERMPASTPQEVKNKLSRLSLSAGAVVCQHKYPLSEAIKKSYEILAHRAKSVSGKDATAVHLIKGHTEALTFAVPNRLLRNIKEMEDKLERDEISRKAPHRFGEERELLEVLLKDDAQAFKRYLVAMLTATRGKESEGNIDETVDAVLKFGQTGAENPHDEIENILAVLLYIRFLTGDRENA